MSDFVEQLQDKIESLEEQVAELQVKLEVLGGHLRHAEEQATRIKIVVGSKLTRRQQKAWNAWIAEVDLSKELKLKSHFAFPKIGMKYVSGTKEDRSMLRYQLTGLTDSSGVFTHEEASDLSEYLNSFPENQTLLKNMDAEFRDPEQEEKAREEMNK